MVPLRDYVFSDKILIFNLVKEIVLYTGKSTLEVPLKPGTHDETFVCNSVLQTKVSWCVRPRNMFQVIFGVS